MDEKQLEYTIRYVKSVHSTTDRLHQLPIMVGSFIETNFFKFRNDVTTKMREPRDVTVHDDKRRDVTKTYGLW